MEKIERPSFIVTPLAEGLHWRGDGTHRFEEKMDGVTARREVMGRGYTATLWGELVKIPKYQNTKIPKYPPAAFYAIDCLEYNGEDLRTWPRRESLKVLDTIVPPGLSAFSFQLSTFAAQRPASGCGGEFLEAVLAKGGEGVVASLLDEPFAAPRWKCKRVETFIVVVLEKHGGGKSSVRVGRAESGKQKAEIGMELSTFNFQLSTLPDLGWLPLFGRKFDQVRVGSVLKVEGYGLTLQGKIREPRVCKDTETSWLVRY